MRVMAEIAEQPPKNTRETNEIFDDPRKHFVFLCEVEPRQQYVARKITPGCGLYTYVSTVREKSTKNSPWLAVCPYQGCGKKSRLDFRTRWQYKTRVEAVREAARRNASMQEEE
jgi:hypothetical protein